MLKEFREFAMKGNVIDMAVGVIIGGAFGALVKSLVSDMLMPPIGLLLGKVDFSNMFLMIKEGSVPGPYVSLAEAQKAGAVTVNYGLFFNVIISFLIVSFAVFFLVRAINRVRRQEAEQSAVAATKECPYCLSAIPLKAVRCGFCTSDIKES